MTKEDKMTHQVVGYVRVSSQGQNTDRQLAEIKLDKKFEDIGTGSLKDREGLNACIEYVREGDTLIVHSIDRLARNLRDLQEIISELVKKGVKVQFVKENLLFTGQNDSMSTLMLHMMGAFSEFERSMIKSRQKEGFDRARKAGKHCGRPLVVTEDIKAKARNLKEQGHSLRKISMLLKISRPSVYKALDMVGYK